MDTCVLVYASIIHFACPQYTHTHAHTHARTHTHTHTHIYISICIYMYVYTVDIYIYYLEQIAGRLLQVDCCCLEPGVTYYHPCKIALHRITFELIQAHTHTHTHTHTHKTAAVPAYSRFCRRFFWLTHTHPHTRPPTNPPTQIINIYMKTMVFVCGVCVCYIYIPFLMV
jgi:hypothetical protein